MRGPARDERADLAAFLATLSPRPWQAVTLCARREYEMWLPLASYDQLDRPGTLRRHQVTDPGARNQPGLDAETRRDGGGEDTTKMLTVYAHQNPRSFCHGVPERFTEGLRDAGHASEVIDLYAIRFNPVFRDRHVASYIADDVSGDILELMGLSSAATRPGGGLGRSGCAIRGARHGGAHRVRYA